MCTLCQLNCSLNKLDKSTEYKLNLNAVKSVADCVMSEHPVYKLTNSDTRGKRGMFASAKLRTSAACLM
jgi:hypothetical protein